VLPWCSLHATALNDVFQLPVWQDSLLWDDAARAVARRLNLDGADNNGVSFFRQAFQGRVSCLGAPLYSIDLYSQDGNAQRLVLGFANAADLHAQGKAMAPRELESHLRGHRDTIIQRLSARLGGPAEKSNLWIWSWLGHQLRLQETSTALILTIEKGDYSPTASKKENLLERDHRAFNPASRVVRRANGDVVVSKIPPISQGDRGFCVPAAWEKNLRYFGVALNVYELAEAGGTRVTGSSFRGFASRLTRELSPLGFKLDYLRQSAHDLDAVASYIDRGLPLVWGIDAQLLREWVAQSRSRRGALPSQPARKLPGDPAYHGLLIIGYNQKNKELALSDTTELGHTTPEIWISQEEARLCGIPSAPLIAVIPPDSLTPPKLNPRTKIY
jgi:hypothetical protein